MTAVSRPTSRRIPATILDRLDDADLRPSFAPLGVERRHAHVRAALAVAPPLRTSFPIPLVRREPITLGQEAGTV